MASIPSMYHVGDGDGEVWIQEFTGYGKYPMEDSTSPDGFCSLLLAGRVTGISSLSIDTVSLPIQCLNYSHFLQAPTCFESSIFMDFETQKASGAFFCPPAFQTLCSASITRLQNWIRSLVCQLFPLSHSWLLILCPGYEHGSPFIAFLHRSPSHRPTVYQFSSDLIFFPEPVPHCQSILVQEEEQPSELRPAYIKELKIFDERGRHVPFGELDTFFRLRRDAIVQVVPYL